MQKHLRINYHLSFWPFVAVFLLLLSCLCALSALQLSLTVKILCAFLLFLLGCWQCQGLLSYPQCLHFDGKQWAVFIDNQPLIVELQAESFMSRFFLVLVFKGAAEGRQFNLFFSRHNCSEADFRALCRLALQ